MTSLWIFAALGTAACFAISSLLAYDAAKALGAVAFSFLRMTVVTAGFAVLIGIVGIDTSLNGSQVSLLALSGVIGVFLADSLRYSSLARIGPQLQSVLNTTTAPFALVLGGVFLGQYVGGFALLGTALVLAGLLIGIFARSDAGPAPFVGVTGSATSGVAFGLASALAQAGSVLIAAPVMLDGVDLVTATFVRSAAGSASLLLPVVMSPRTRAQVKRLSRPIAKQVFLSAAIGTGLGMSLQLAALREGPVGVVAVLTSTTPLMILPMIWVLGRARPPIWAWLGALCAVIGVAFIVSGR